MANDFDFLTRAKPGSVYKLLQRLPPGDAAIVLTGLPQTMVVQILAYFPDDAQAALLPAMREARQLPPERKAATAESVKAIIRSAKTSRHTNPDAAPTRAEPPAPAAPPAPKPAAPPRPAAPGGNPYAGAPAPKAPAADAAPGPGGPSQPSPFANIGSKLKDALKHSLTSLGAQETPAASAPADAAPPRRTSSLPPRRTPRREPPAKPLPWVPRTATTSPINGPALPNTPPPVAGDPLQSPLAQAGLLDLIGRAQEKLLPKSSASRARSTPPRRPAARPLPGKRPEPREGVALPGEVEVGSTPRVIGPRPRGPAPARPEAGARRMDGKAILAAILREAGPDVRGQVRGEDPILFKQLRDRMFHFDDFIYTEDNALARVFTAAPADTAALALKFAAPALRDRVLRVVSPGRARALTDDPGRASLDDVEAAQKGVLAVALQLQAAGRILIDPRDPDLAGA